MIEFLSIAALGLVMGIVTSISGGAGVFAIPTMLAFGIPPINTLALNRMSDLGVVIGALRGYHKSKSINWKLALIIMIPLGIGSFFGANLVVRLPEGLLRYIIIIGVFVGIFFLLKPAKPKKDLKKEAMSIIGLLFMLLVGIWSGALAMAGATFAVLVLVHFFHKSFLEARSTDIVAAIPETAIALTILALASTVSISLLATMFVSSFIGAWIGSHLAVKHGDELIRKAMIGIAILMIIKVVFDF
ncbi:sulfite exporter TauE/SafE family protein [Patescibacteria group bacterium]|nr:sulfite exporter TauE/SafE family protein [Patescibacteria group bacterium]MBU1682951.1 sulfite exporter TauE/SafE family protein [Patescibacteria group bacterium]